MARTKLSLMIVGSIILLLLGSLITYFLLLATNQISGDSINLEVTILDNSKEYDGTELNATEYEITKGSLLKGHVIEADYYGGITNVGVGESNCNLKIVDENGKDHSSDYSINVKKGKLEITKRPITLSIKNVGTNYDPNRDIITEYDDNITDEIDYQIISDLSLCKGHKLVPEFETSEINTLDGDYNEANVFMVASVYDINGFDVTSNYSISYQDDMKIKISKPAITLTTLSSSKVYDGESFSEDELGYSMKGNLPSGYTVDVNYINNISNIQNVEDSEVLRIDKDNCKILDNNGNDVTNNYVILIQNVGYISITPRTINIEADDSQFIYDGESHKNEAFTIIEDDSITKNGNDGFVLNDYNFNIKVENPTTITDVGTKVNKLNFKVTKAIDTTETDLSDNFRFVYDNMPIISVIKRDITIIGKSIDINYDSNRTVMEDELATRLDELEYDYDCGIDVDYDIYFKPIINVNITGSGYYNCMLTEIRIDNGQDITSNFNIYSTGYTLHVIKELVILTNRLVIPYNSTLTLEEFVKSNLKINDNVDFDLFNFDNLTIGENSLVEESGENIYKFKDDNNTFTLVAEVLVDFVNRFEYGDEINKDSLNLSVNKINKFVDTKPKEFNVNINDIVDDNGYVKVSEYLMKDIVTAGSLDENLYELVFEKNLIVSKRTVTITWRNILANGNYTLTDDDFESNFDKSLFSAVQTTIYEPDVPTMVSYYGTVEVKDPQYEKNFIFNYIPGIITFD